MIVAAIGDLKTMTIPNYISVAIVILGIIKTAYDRQFTSHLIGFFVSLAMCMLCYFVSKRGLGLGDVKLLVSLGLFMGMELFVGSIAIVAVIAFVVGLILLILHRIDTDTYIPFAPFIAFGSVTTIIFELIRS